MWYDLQNIKRAPKIMVRYQPHSPLQCGCNMRNATRGSFTNYVYKMRQVGGLKMSTFCQSSYHLKCHRSGQVVKKKLSMQFVNDPLHNLGAAPITKPKIVLTETPSAQIFFSSLNKFKLALLFYTICSNKTQDLVPVWQGSTTRQNGCTCRIPRHKGFLE